jgi:non-heme chloroperoxidase
MEKTYSNYLTLSDQQKIFYTTNFSIDDGPHEDVLIFLYGLVCSNHHWSKQLEYFDKAGYKILIHDYRGHYQSTNNDLEKLNFIQIASDLNHLLERCDIKNGNLISHSMGVNVALEFYRQYPQHVNKIVLISGTIMPVDNVMLDSNFIDHIRPLATKVLSKHPELVKTLWKYTGWNPFIKRLIHQEGFNMERVSDEFIEIYLNRIGQLGPEMFFQLMEQMNRHDILTLLRKVNCPTLIIGGDKDKVIPNYLQHLLQKHIHHSELYIVKNGSHVPQVDFPEFINTRMVQFFDKDHSLSFRKELSP